ncbi:hypothetical protein ACHQM5_022432 [Ranunculus cassubicifolius]
MHSSCSSVLQWLSLVGIIWLQSINGTNTDFSAYSSQYKKLLSISQIKLNNLAFASDAGKLFGWVSGLATAYLPLWLVLIIGASLGLIGYGVQFLFLAEKITFLSYWQIFFLTVLAGNSICWINTVCYATITKNFRSNAQTAVGLSTSYSGLSAMTYTNIVDVISPSSSTKKAKTYLFLNSVVPLLVAVVTSPFFRDVKVKKKENGLETRFIVMFIIAVATGTYAVICTLGLLNLFPQLAHAIVLGILLACPLLVLYCVNKRECRIHDVTVDETCDLERDSSIEVKEEEEDEEEEVVISESNVMQEIGVKLMLRKVEFWLYFFVYMFGATLGLVYLNNLGQIAESRGHPRSSSLVSLSSSFGFFGRLIPSILEHFFSKSKRMVAKPTAIAILMTPMAGAFFLLLVSNNICLFISTAIIGVCTGAISSIAVSTTTELFGTTNFNVNHNIVVANIPIGSFVFGYLAAVLYQKEGHGGRCMGDDCYRKTFLLWGTICAVGTFLSFILYHRTKKFYKQIL